MKTRNLRKNARDSYSNKMEKSIVISMKKSKTPYVRKIVLKTKKYVAHDEKNIVTLEIQLNNGN